MCASESALSISAPRILIVRTSALGDIVQALPVLEAIKRLRPASRVAWAVEGSFAELLEGHPKIDDLIRVRSKEWRKNPLSGTTASEVLALRRTLREFRPDVALDLMSNTKAALLARLSGAPIRVGLASVHRREPASATLLNELVEPFGIHAVERALSVLRPFGLDRAAAPIGGNELDAGPLPGELPDHPFVIIHPGAGWKNKELPTEMWSRIASRLAHEAALTVLVVTGPGEEKMGEAIAKQSSGAVCHLDVPGLKPLVALQRRASLVLAGDTGPLHLAHALGRPVVCVMGPTDPERHGPWLARDSVVFRRLPCSFCHKRLASPRGCLVGLPTGKIVEAALHRLQKTAP